MQKKLQNDLISLAHSILQMKNQDDVITLHQKATAVCEKLSLLKFIDYYVETTPENKQTKEELISKVTKAWDTNSQKQTTEKTEEKQPLPIKETPAQEEISEEVDLKNNINETLIKKEVSEEVAVKNTIEETEKEEPLPKVEVPQEKIDSKGIFDKKLIKIPLNDRISIVNDLFEGKQSDFNRVLSQLNSFETEQEALHFIKKMVKPDYQWENFKNTETLFTTYISEKFSTKND